VKLGSEFTLRAGKEMVRVSVEGLSNLYSNSRLRIAVSDRTSHILAVL